MGDTSESRDKRTVASFGLGAGISGVQLPGATSHRVGSDQNQPTTTFSGPKGNSVLKRPSPLLPSSAFVYLDNTPHRNLVKIKAWNWERLDKARGW